MIVTFAQGLAQLARASEAYGYHLDLEEVARIWRGGCIIRAGLLEEIRAAYRAGPICQTYWSIRIWPKRLWPGRAICGPWCKSPPTWPYLRRALWSRWPISTAIAALGCRPILSKPSATISGPYEPIERQLDHQRVSLSHANGWMRINRVTIRRIGRRPVSGGAAVAAGSRGLSFRWLAG